MTNVVFAYSALEQEWKRKKSNSENIYIDRCHFISTIVDIKSTSVEI